MENNQPAHYETGQDRRQAVLDCLHQNAGSAATIPEIAQATGMKYMACVSALRSLRRNEQVEELPVDGLKRYRAIATTAIPDKKISKERIERAQKAAAMKVKLDVFMSSASVRVYQNKPDKNVPIKNQGGQGAMRRDPRCGCSLT